MKTKKAKNRKIYVNWPLTATIIAVIILLILIYREWKKNKSTDTEDEAGDEVQDRELTYPDATYYQFADALFIAFNPNALGWGTDEEEVYRILKKLKTPSDWFKLVSAFGEQQGGTLPKWLSFEFTDSGMEKIESILSEIGVTI